MRLPDSPSMRRTSRLLMIALGTVGLVTGAGDLKRDPSGVYHSPVTIEPDAPNFYSLHVKDAGNLTFSFKAGVTIRPEGSCGALSPIRPNTSVHLINGCTLTIMLTPTSAIWPLVITGREPSDGLPDEAPRVDITLLPTQSTFDRLLASSAYGLGAVLLLAGAGLGVFLLARRRRDGYGRELRRVNQDPSHTSAVSQPRPPILRTSAAAPPPASVQYASQSDLETLSQSLQNVDKNFWNLVNVQKRQNSELGTQLSQFVERCQTAAEEAVERAAISALRAAGEATKETERMRRRLEALEADLKGLRAESSKGLSNLLQALPREALAGLSVSDQAGSDLAQKLEQAVARYLREEQPCARSLEAYTQQVGTLRSAIKQFMQIASESAAGQADPRLDPLDRDLDLIAQELAGFTRQGTDKRFRLLFAVDFSARQTLTEGIAAGLQREIVKLDNLDDYYTKRIGMLSAQVAAECADLADSVLDPQRAKPDVKSALQTVFTVAGVEEIAPRRNDPFLGTDHAMFQMIRRSSAVDRSGAVAQTVSRGLRQRDRVVRKATVTLFE